MKIGHISDIHWLDTEGTHFSDFLNKRVSGYINLVAGRAKTHTKEATLCAFKALKKLRCDKIVVTGDLTNLSLPAEFQGIKTALNKYFADCDIMVVPGNHDFYTQESAQARRFESYMYPTPPGNLDLGIQESWPYVYVHKDVAFIGLNSAYPRPWFVASGKIGSVQLENLRKVLEREEVRDCYKIVALHHHLFQILKSPGETLRHLSDRKELLQICQEGHVNLILHGHNHDYCVRRVGDIVVAEAGSCSVCQFTEDNRAGKFNVYTVEKGALQQIDTYRFENGEYGLWKSWKPDEIGS